MGISRREFIFGGMSSFALAGMYSSTTLKDHVLRDFPYGNFNFIKVDEPRCKPLKNPIDLSIGTWNLASIPLVQYSRFEMSPMDRMANAAEVLVEEDPDIIGLQEMFSPWNREDILENLDKRGSRLKYHVYFPSRVLGSGLFTLSAYPLENADFKQFTSQGNPFKFWEGDWHAGKGVGHNNIRINGDLCLDFCNTHVHAKYDGKNDLYEDTRRHQRSELVEYARESSMEDGLMILAGDLNGRRSSKEIIDFERESGYLSMTNVNSIESESKDYVHAQSNIYNVELLETKILPEVIEGRQVSDHHGYVSKIQIS